MSPTRIRRVLAALVFVGLFVAVLPSWRAEAELVAAVPRVVWRGLLDADLDQRTRLALGDDYEAYRLVAEHVPRGAVVGVQAVRDAERLREIYEELSRNVFSPEQVAIRRLERIRGVLIPLRLVYAHELAAQPGTPKFVLALEGEAIRDAEQFARVAARGGFVLWRGKAAGG